MADPIDVFISYAPKDEALREELAVHLAMLLRRGEIRAFDASQMRPGAAVQAEAFDRLTRARLILLLVSADFLASNACDAEAAQALERHGAGEAIVFPVILRKCDWMGASFAKLMPLPRKSEAIASAKDRDEAWAEVVEAIRAAIALLKVRPLPSYQDAAIQALCDRVEEAGERKRRLLEVGGDTTEVDREIRDLRRQLREGGQLRAGDALGNGRYLLLRQVGRGGFAIVWEAHDRERDERVAVKVLHSNLAGDRIRLERFFRGARTMAELEHEHVVRVREQRGEDGGYHYFVMEFIAGDDLRQAVLKKALSGDAVISVILKVGEALALAHERGLVHRDVKPANILLDAAGAPRLTDFDLVGGRDTTGGTRTGGLGTVVYTAPEITDRPQDADARADVYSLGMSTVFGLYGAELTLLVVRHLERLIDKMSCSDAVKGVLKRAVDWEKEARYEDAGAFCAALREAAAEQRVSGEVRAAPVPEGIACNAVAPGTVVGDIIVAGYGDGSIRLWRGMRRVGLRLIATVRNAHEGAITSVAVSPSGEVVATASADKTVRVWWMAEILTQKGPRPKRILEAHSDAVWSVSWSNDERTLASGSGDNTVRVWDVDKGIPRQVWQEHSAAVRSVAFQPGGLMLASGALDSRVIVVAGGVPRVYSGIHNHGITTLAWAPDGARLVSGLMDGTLFYGDELHDVPSRFPKQHKSSVRCVAWNPDGQILASGSSDKTIMLWDMGSKTEPQLLRLLEGHKAGVTSVAFNADGTMLVSAAEDGKIRLWEVATGICDDER